jgi:hypothetical protein
MENLIPPLGLEIHLSPQKCLAAAIMNSLFIITIVNNVLTHIPKVANIELELLIPELFTNFIYREGGTQCIVYLTSTARGECLAPTEREKLIEPHEDSLNIRSICRPSTRSSS